MLFTIVASLPLIFNAWFIWNYGTKVPEPLEELNHRYYLNKRDMFKRKFHFNGSAPLHTYNDKKKNIGFFQFKKLYGIWMPLLGIDNRRILLPASQVDDPMMTSQVVETIEHQIANSSLDNLHLVSEILGTSLISIAAFMNCTGPLGLFLYHFIFSLALDLTRYLIINIYTTKYTQQERLSMIEDASRVKRLQDIMNTQQWKQFKDRFKESRQQNLTK